ncbi:phosphate ABC transporter substrate-binding protein [Massilia sp. H6]|uniref:phosphate ABC transporter substrate-binding protein n=1 Tax=Massilia sp. H6 TaxID=2970464 RepID=UPI00216A330A|nr:phosphate ABC transporter substrate-binding protein [Massilia sp. H6]UVW30170.1 phosphate ABC transporter substrate-binding protein [Massilia sp. H6]
MGIHIHSILAAAIVALAASGNASAELVVIVSARSVAPTLSSDQVAAIFLGQAGSLPDGVEVAALDQRIGSNERIQFYQQVTGKTPALLKAHWSKMIFTGRGQPPREVADNGAVRRMVADNPAMIGYIDRAALDASVRPVLVLR